MGRWNLERGGGGVKAGGVLEQELQLRGWEDGMEDPGFFVAGRG